MPADRAGLCSTTQIPAPCHQAICAEFMTTRYLTGSVYMTALHMPHINRENNFVSSTAKNCSSIPICFVNVFCYVNSRSNEKVNMVSLRIYPSTQWNLILKKISDDDVIDVRGSSTCYREKGIRWISLKCRLNEFFRCLKISSNNHDP